MLVPLRPLLILALTFFFFPVLAGAEPKSDYFGSSTPPSPDASASLPQGKPDWYKDDTFYHVWLYSFADSDGNGVGDIPGVTSKLDYLKSLGITAIWLSPFWKSPSTHGYDVVDYSVVDPRYGTNADLRTLLKAAHSRGMKVIFDFVPNHVSAQNPWFTDSRDKKNGRRNWFLWKDRVPSQGWKDFGGNPAWHGAGWSNYYAIFWDQMPDLNYREPEVRQAMADVITTWLNFGFDGMRVDAVKYLFEDEATGANADQPETLDFFRNLRREVLDPYTALGYPKFMVSENWTTEIDNLKAYLSSDGKSNDGLHATLDFPFGYGVTQVLNGSGTLDGDLGREWDNLIRPLQEEGAWTLTFLSNHDNYQSRPLSLYQTLPKVRVAQALQMTLWGTPVVYYGNEIGMTGNNGNDQNMRRPFPWKQVAAAQSDAESLWRWQSLLGGLRQDHPALRRGDLRFLTPSPDQAVAYLRTLGEDQILVVLNLSGEALGPFVVEVATLGGNGGLSTLVGSEGTVRRQADRLAFDGLGAYGVKILQLGPRVESNLRGDFLDLP